MLNENAQKWVDALRSGEYEQCRGHLSTGDKYCCLGVACELYLKENPYGLRVVNYPEGKTYDGHTSALPETVLEWLNLKTNFGFYHDISSFGVQTEQSLSGKNDDGKNFRQIADIIESKHEQLFRNPNDD